MRETANGDSSTRQKKLVIPYEYDEVRPFEDGLAMVRTGEVWGYIDKSGKTVIPFEYDDVSNFNEGHAFVKKDGELGLIDSLGNITRDYEVMKEYILPFSWPIPSQSSTERRKTASPSG